MNEISETLAQKYLIWFNCNKTNAWNSCDPLYQNDYLGTNSMGTSTYKENRNIELETELDKQIWNKDKKNKIS